MTVLCPKIQSAVAFNDMRNPTRHSETKNRHPETTKLKDNHNPRIDTKTTREKRLPWVPKPLGNKKTHVETSLSNWLLRGNRCRGSDRRPCREVGCIEVGSGVGRLRVDRVGSRVVLHRRGLALHHHLLHGIRILHLPRHLLVVRRARGPNQRQHDGKKDHAVPEPEEADGEELPEEEGEDVRLGCRHDDHGEEGRHGPVGHVGPHLGDRLHHTLVVRARVGHEGVGDVSRVVDGETDGQHEVDDGDGVDRDVPQPHDADNVEEHHGDVCHDDEPREPMRDEDHGHHPHRDDRLEDRRQGLSPHHRVLLREEPRE
mmetsp:Transcript_9528/g.18487  ORF Transcript_9528/g.18487 Transcript_9528/m.18487 type:complete len:315 (-) Transcript_9528:2880-3824(-)